MPEPRVVVELLRRALTTLPRTVTHLAIGIQGPALSFGAPEHATDGASKERAALHVAILQAVNDAATGGPTRFSVTLLAGGCAGAQALEVRTLPPSLWSGGGGNVFAVEISTGSALPLAPVRDGAGAGAGRGRHSVEGAGRGPDRARMSQGGNATSHHEIATVSTAMHHMEERTRGDPGSGRHGDIPEERAALASAWDPGTGAREDAAEKPVEEGTIESPLPQQRPQSSESPRVQPQQPSLRRRGSALGNFMKRLSMDGHAHGDARQLAQDMWEVPCKGAPPRGSGGAPAPAWCVFHPVTGVTRSAASVKSGLETAASLAPPQQSPSVKPLQAVQEDFATVETAPQPRARPASRLCGCFGGRANAVDDARVLGTDSVERAQQSHVGFSLPANHRDSAGAVPGASGRLSGSHVGQSSARSSGGWRFSGGGGSRNGSVADGGAKGLVARIRRSLHLSQAERSTAEVRRAGLGVTGSRRGSRGEEQAWGANEGATIMPWVLITFHGHRPPLFY